MEFGKIKEDCAVCRRIVKDNDEALEYDGCGHWQHRTCGHTG